VSVDLWRIDSWRGIKQKNCTNKCNYFCLWNNRLSISIYLFSWAAVARSV
jgi:hypothetical protein